MIKAVIFDIDNTLYSYDQADIYGMQALQTYCKKYFCIEEKEMKAVYDKAMSIEAERIGTDTAAIHSRMLRFQCMTELFGQPLFPHSRNMYHAYWDTLINHMVPAPGIRELMENLKKQGICIGIGTDMTAYIQFRKLEVLGLAPFIDRIITSEEAGVEKPHPKFFSLCVEKCGCKAEECLFIGDNIYKDVLGAIHNGLHGIWFTQGEIPAEEKPFPVIISYKDGLPLSLSV